MTTALYPGSFDPFTLGHLDVLERAIAIFDKVVVAVLENPSKTPAFTVDERIEMIREAAPGDGQVDVGAFQGLTVDYAQAVGATSIVRGLRATIDFESEFQMALMNRKLAPEISTVFLMTSFANVFLSSSLIKEVARLGGDVSFAVPPSVAKRLARLKEVGP
ncbi:MAG TPA: pantetheine-phosphate adenylyltransferase [Candidatus Dormibacteraeota bacterium]|jgi:pantetheine-phosphate adenylyltransferase|nr:pantetheine-phosphate adenylyltransferase [Candidatus Dormibacteraeota bacterium]